jgi:glycosyltransferase involved in cell wall biosynthesis
VNVLQIHGADTGKGGGAIAMLRLQDGLRRARVRSRILCINPTLGDSVAIPRLRGEGRLRALTSRLGFNELHLLGSFKIPNMTVYGESDLLHIHCLHGGFFSYLALPHLTRGKPAIYTLHDMWPLTGHCIQSLDCDRWKAGCGQCPYPEMPNKIQRDATWWEWKLKDWGYRRSDLTIVVPSTWLYRLVGQSMLKHFPIQHLPHGLDTDVYQPLDREMSRSALGIPMDKKVLLYMVRRMDSSHITGYLKGADLLHRAIQEMPASLRRETMIVLIGEGSEAFARELDMVAMSLGVIFNDRLKALAYSAADLFVFPSRAENSPLVLIESMACGTPTVAFNVGGVPDLVRPGVTGLLADPQDSKGLSAGIVQLLEDDTLRDYLSHQCRAIAVKEYGLDLYVERHIALYRQLVESKAA